MSIDLLYAGSDPERIATLVTTSAFNVCVVDSLDRARDRLAIAPFDVLVLDRADDEATTFLTTLSHTEPSLPVVIETDTHVDIPQSLYDETVTPGAVDELVAVVDSLLTDAPTEDDAEVGQRSVGDGGVTAGPITDQSYTDIVGDRTFAEAVVKGLPDILFLTDLGGNMLRWNDRLNAITGFTDEEIRAKSPSDFFEEVIDVRRKVAVMQGDTDIRFTADLKTASGDVIPYELTASLVGCGDAQFICGVARDITERREAERQLDAAVKELEQSNTELEQFAYVASHDMKEPLRMVSSYLELLERRYGDQLDEDAQEFIEFAVEGSERMREMINGLLAYSRVGRQMRDFERVDMNDILETAQSNLRIAIEESDAVVEADDLPTLRCDAGQLTQLFQNLVANAIKYTDDDTDPRISITVGRDEDEWVFAVADNGIGIPEDRQGSVFEIFSGEGAQKGTGSGIGLAICEKIVGHHGGRIWVDSAVGEGSTFSFTIPDDGERETATAE